MLHRTDDIRIKWTRVVLPPVFLEEEMPMTEKASSTVYQTRMEIGDILGGKDHRVLVIVGPCSIHDTEAAREYAALLKTAIDELSTDLRIVMRVYFEKARTTIGWKGLINDPHLDQSFKINDGLRLARRLLLDLAEMGVPAGTEFLDMIIPQYMASLVSWGAIGARTTESQVHRELVSGLSCPVGFKNGTSGDVANSHKDYTRQPTVCREVIAQIATGDRHVIGVMLESNLVAGAQKPLDGKPLVYGQSSLTPASDGTKPRSCSENSPRRFGLLDGLRKRHNKPCVWTH
jgi:3-deoxy-D-arabino-heptulosonate 7-phosphate (DAHP) synthase